MRKITQYMVHGFARGIRRKRGGDKVWHNWFTGYTIYELYGTWLVRRGSNGRLEFNFPSNRCTATTAERLNGFLQHFNLGHCTRRQGEWYYNGEKL